MLVTDHGRTTARRCVNEREGRSRFLDFLRSCGWRRSLASFHQGKYLFLPPFPFFLLFEKVCPARNARGLSRVHSRNQRAARSHQEIERHWSTDMIKNEFQDQHAIGLTRIRLFVCCFPFFSSSRPSSPKRYQYSSN
jgi:hypothetical protein